MPITKVGYYQIDRLLGEGGMGAVYQATHQMTGRRVAVKTLRPELAERADLNARFFNEARTMSFLEHPSIVRVHDVGRTSDGTAYMVMDLCEGPTLGELMRQEPRVEVKLGLLAAVADALAHAHQNGVIHRDLKPDNVIVTSSPEGPRPRVLDFGIAKVLDGAVAAGSPFAVKTRTGTAMGTPLYMSPEQCRGVGGITQATDVYALGVMLYEALRGRVPFDGGVGEVIVQHITTPAPSLAGLGLPAADALSALVARMLEKEPEKRPTMVTVVEILGRYTSAQGAESAAPAGLPVEERPQALAAIFVPEEAPARPVAAVAQAPSGTAAAVPTPQPQPTMGSAASLTPAPPPGRTMAPRPGARATSTVIPLVVGCLVAGSAIGLALLRRSTTPARVAPERVAPERVAPERVAPERIAPERVAPGRIAPERAAPVAPADLAEPSLRVSAPTWRIESTPSGADVFAADGALLGRTPFTADALIGRGARVVYVRHRGYEDEVVRYDSSGSSKLRLRERVAPHPSIRPRIPAKHDDFEITPLH